MSITLSLEYTAYFVYVQEIGDFEYTASFKFDATEISSSAAQPCCSWSRTIISKSHSQQISYIRLGTRAAGRASDYFLFPQDECLPCGLRSDIGCDIFILLLDI